MIAEFWSQFIKNMLVGTGFAAIWYFGIFSFIPNFWIATIITNLIGFFLGRYWIYRKKEKK